MKLDRALAGLAALAAVAIGSATAPAPAAAEFPERSIELVCPHQEGNRAAAWCAMMAELTGRALGATVKPVFMPDGGAARYLASRPADGHTWLEFKPTPAAVVDVERAAPDPDAFTLLVNIDKLVFVLGVAADAGYDSFEDLVAAMRARPGQIAIAANGIGSAHHIHVKRLFDSLGVSFRLVPIEGSGEAMRTVLDGGADAAITPPHTWTKSVQAGKAQLLLLLNEERVEQGDLAGLAVPKDFGADYAMSHQLQGLLVRSGTPEPARAAIKAAARAAMDMPEYRDYLSANAYAVPAFTDDEAANTEWFRQLRIEVGRLMDSSELTQ
jgi:tripartite-type tricarboxylate transporter receptor subunit TctC